MSFDEISLSPKELSVLKQINKGRKSKKHIGTIYNADNKNDVEIYSRLSHCNLVNIYASKGNTRRVIITDTEKDYLQYRKLDFYRFCSRSICVPIGVSIVTTIVTTLVTILVTNFIAAMFL